MIEPGKLILFKSVLNVTYWLKGRYFTKCRSIAINHYQENIIIDYHRNKAGSD